MKKHKDKDDIELVKEAQEGNSKAFTALYNKYYNIVFYFSYAILKNREDSEDVAIEALTKAFNNINNYIPKHKFKTWLLRIALNQCIDLIRKKERRPLLADEINDIETYVTKLRDPEISPEDILIGDEELKVFKDMIKRLNPVSKKVLELRLEKHLTYEEIAKELNVKIGTVKGQIHRAKGNLYKLITKVK